MGQAVYTQQEYVRIAGTVRVDYTSTRWKTFAWNLMARPAPPSTPLSRAERRIRVLRVPTETTPRNRGADYEPIREV